MGGKDRCSHANHIPQQLIPEQIQHQGQILTSPHRHFFSGVAHLRPFARLLSH